MSGDRDRLVTQYMTNGGYKNQGRCSSDIRSALEHYRGLQPTFQNFTFNDGTSKELICLKGTIPVPYRGTNYNIPLAIWVLDTHPMHAPMCFVCPTQDMQIRVSRHVDYQGKVYLPYLHEWNEQNSDILGLIQLCIITFSEQPPVFAKPANVAPVQQSMPYPPASSNYQPSPSYSGYQNQTSDSSTISQDYLKASLVTAVEEKIRRSLREDFNTKQVEIESLKKIKEELQASQNTTKASMQTMTSEATKLQDYLDLLTHKKKELEDTKNAMAEGDTLDVDELVQVGYPLYNQLLKSFAEDAAIDDSIYFLGEALRRGVIDCDNFLKNVRNISRKQFEHRLTMMRCRTKARLDL